MTLFSIDALAPRPLAALSHHLSRLVEGRLWLKVLIGLALGIAVGFAIGPQAGLLAPDTGALLGTWLALPGRLFLAAIQMIVIPLVFASIIRGLAASQSAQQLQRLGLAAIGFFVVTTAVASAIGIGIADLVRPGDYLPHSALASMRDLPPTNGAPAAPSMANLPQLLIDLLPGNPLNSMVQGEMLQVVLFAVVVGVALVSMPAVTARPLLDLLGSLQEVCMTVVRWAMLLAPVAVFGLMAQLASRTGVDVMVGVGVYMLTVFAGLACMVLVYVLVLRFALAAPVLAFFRKTREVLLLAFSTSSSAAVMPLSIKTAQEALGVRPSVAQFVIPLGATINMNGTALYQAVAASFLAQVFGVELGLSGTALIVAMTVGASIGSPATPGVGIVILAMVLDGIGVPAAGIALIMGVDRILDMTRTAVNVTGDLVASQVVDRWAGGPMSAEEELSELATLASVRQATGADTLITDEIASGST